MQYFTLNNFITVCNLRDNRLSKLFQTRAHNQLRITNVVGKIQLINTNIIKFNSS